MTGKQKKTLIRCIVALVLVVAVSIFARNLNVWIQLPLYLIPYFIVGYDVLIGAAKNIRNGQVFDEKFLMTVATIGAIGTGEFREGVAVMLFYQIGELFQSIAVGRSRRNISELMDIRPDVAYVVGEDGSVSEEDPDDVEIGSVLRVNPGEKVPIDGVVIEGESSLDTVALTGESVPRMVRPGDEVISGCIALSGQIKIRTEKEFGDSTVSKILELMENSSLKKAKAENFISKFARYYTPIVCYSALALAILPPVIRLIMGLSPEWLDWLMRALTFLVISCPCAVVISVPLSFFGGIGCASSRGILVKGSNYLEALADTGTIVFDKTGTITKGVFEVNDITAAPGVERAELLRYAACAEDASSHPIALSIKRAYEDSVANGSSGEDLSGGVIINEIKEITGKGVSALVRLPEGDKISRIYAGSLKLMEDIGCRAEEAHSAGTVVYVAAANCSGAAADITGDTAGETVRSNAVKHEEGATRYLGSISISDEIKDSASEAMRSLRDRGICTVMLTGDTEKAAAYVAEKVGVSEYKAELLPQDKVREVEALMADRSRNIAFVGDGINDAPVLARADIGIAMGAMGSDAAIEAADIVLMDDDPAKLSLAMKISAKTLKIVRQNIVFAIAVKVICLVLSALGIANMWLAIFADVGVMIIAVLNATRTLKIK